jgi:RNA polymerase sigma-70 factor (ECF subfamily)
VDFEIVSASSPQTSGMKREPPPHEGPDASASQVVAALYAQAYPMVWGILGRAGIWRKADRCELAHDAFIVAQQVHARRDPRVPLRAWLAAITWNVARNHRALERVKRETPVDHVEPVSSEASPEETVIRRRHLVDLFEGLDDERRAVFDMHEIEGFEIPEIARALGIPVGTATTRLRLAREHVRAANARLEAAAAHAERRPVVVPALLPFGVGAWHDLGQAFEVAPPGTERQVWRDIVRTLAATGALGRAAGAAIAVKTILALVGAGAVLGGGAVLVALSLSRLPASPAGSPSGSISRAAAPVVVTVVEADASGAPSDGASAIPVPVPSGAASASARPGPTGAPVVRTIDPEEERLIQQAQAAFARRNYDAARDALREHAARFPHGQLVVDRRSLLAQMPPDAGPTSPNPGGPSSPLDGGRAPHRQFGTDD